MYVHQVYMYTVLQFSYSYSSTTAVAVAELNPYHETHGNWYSLFLIQGFEKLIFFSSPVLASYQMTTIFNCAKCRRRNKIIKRKKEEKNGTVNLFMDSFFQNIWKVNSAKHLRLCLHILKERTKFLTSRKLLSFSTISTNCNKLNRYTKPSATSVINI